jgi:hypothetical protein
VALVTKIEALIAGESFDLALSALVSAALRLEICKCNGNEWVAAKTLALALEDIARKSDN